MPVAFNVGCVLREQWLCVSLPEVIVRNPLQHTHTHTHARTHTHTHTHYDNMAKTIISA